MSVAIPFAHAGHWLAGLAYAAPVIVLVVWILVVKIKERTAARRGSSKPTVDDGST